MPSTATSGSLTRRSAKAVLAKRKRVVNNGTHAARREQAAGRKLALRLLNRPAFRASLNQKLDDLSIHPSVLTALMYMAYGRPTEHQEVTQTVPVRVEHVYSE